MLGAPIPPLPADELGRGGQLVVFLALCFLLVVLVYFSFEIVTIVLTEEFRADLKHLEARRAGRRRWWML